MLSPYPRVHLCREFQTHNDLYNQHGTLYGTGTDSATTDAAAAAAWAFHPPRMASHSQPRRIAFSRSARYLFIYLFHTKYIGTGTE